MSIQHGMVVDGHLGGYVPGGDPDTWYPELWAWMIEQEGVRSMIDVGCGEGQTLDWFTENGCDAVGVDGMPQQHDRILKHDYTRDPLAAWVGGRWSFDLAWSAEFVEHIEERHVPNFLATFRLARLVLMTHAIPGQPGWHHVNCRHADYWIGVLSAAGFTLDLGMTETTRDLAASNGRETNYYRDTGLAFRRIA